MSENAKPKIKGNQQGTRDNYKKIYGKWQDAFRGTTTGLEYVVFKYLLSSMNASTIKSNCYHLAEHIGIHFQKGASVDTNSMIEGVSLVYVKPYDPKIEAGKTIGLVEKSKAQSRIEQIFRGYGSLDRLERTHLKFVACSLQCRYERDNGRIEQMGCGIPRTGRDEIP